MAYFIEAIQSGIWEKKMLEFKKTLSMLKDFLQPISKIDSPNRSQISFESLIGSLIGQFKSTHSELTVSTGESDCLWEFGWTALKLLETLDSSHVDDPPACLSIEQERNVATLCELIVSFAIHYSLEEGVGVPIDRLSKYGANLRLKRESIDARTRNFRLYQIFQVLWEIKMAKRKPDLDLISRYFYRKNLHIIVCALLQLVYSPNSELSDKQHFKKWIDEDIFEETDGANIVSSIMMAQGL